MKTVDYCTEFSETVARRCSVKEVFLTITQIPQEKTCAEVSLTQVQVFSCQFCEIFKNNFFIERRPCCADCVQNQP